MFSVDPLLYWNNGIFGVHLNGRGPSGITNVILRFIFD